MGKPSFSNYVREEGEGARRWTAQKEKWFTSRAGNREESSEKVTDAKKSKRGIKKKIQAIKKKLDSLTRE